jgi:hypothetical protein
MVVFVGVNIFMVRDGKTLGFSIKMQPTGAGQIR